VAAADLDLVIRNHQPDGDGNCALCKTFGDVVPYPCDARLLCERASIALERKA
jgi:hypothetical protein